MTTGRSNRSCRRWVSVSLICWALNIFSAATHSPAPSSSKNITVNSTVRKNSEHVPSAKRAVRERFLDGVSFLACFLFFLLMYAYAREDINCSTI